MDGDARVMRLSDPALIGLAVLASEQWPMLAARWLGEGYDSQALRDFAVLTPAEAAVLSGLMADVLRSLGMKIEQTEPFEASVFELSGFAERCRIALGVVQRDLDRTGHSDLQMQPINCAGDGWPPQAYAALSSGEAAGSSGQPMTADMDDEVLVGVAAAAVCETLLLVAHIRWPRCIRHPRRYMIAGPDPAARNGREAPRFWWWCNADDKHPVAPIGELTETA